MSLDLVTSFCEFVKFITRTDGESFRLLITYIRWKTRTLPFYERRATSKPCRRAEVRGTRSAAHSAKWSAEVCPNDAIVAA